MAENLKISQAQEENVNEYGREHNEKLQSLARSMVAGLYMLVRSVKMYDPENAVFQKPLHQLQDIINQIIGKEGRLELTGVKESFYLNGMLVKVDLNSIENQRYLLAELRAKDVGGFTLTKPATVPELKNFVWIFSKEQSATTEEDGLAAIRRVVTGARRFLEPGGLLAMEIGETQGPAVLELLRAAGYADARVEKDLERRERMAFGTQPVADGPQG